MKSPDISPPTGPEAASWFYKTDEGKTGPVSLAVLCDKIASGALSAESLVWRPGQDSWLPALAFGELREAVAAHNVAAASRARSRPGRTILAGVAIVAALLAWRFVAGLLGVAAVADVTGTVTDGSRPVTGGSVILSPVAPGRNDTPGRPGVAAIKPDGSFALQLQPGSRGLADRFTVRFAPPVLPPMSESEAMEAVPPYHGYVPKRREIEIRAGANRVDIEIVPSSKD